MHTVTHLICQQFLGAIALAGLVVALAGTATGATGGFLRLGGANVASKVTRLRNTGNDPALLLIAPPGTPVLDVSNSTLVSRLNAAMVGGKPASALARAKAVYSKVNADARFIAKGSPQLLHYAGVTAFLASPDETAGVVTVYVVAPAAGVITARAEGRCFVAAGTVLLVATVISAGTGNTVATRVTRDRARPGSQAKSRRASVST